MNVVALAQLVQVGAPLRLMGCSLQDAILLFGKWEGEGVNAERVTGCLRITAGEFADGTENLRGPVTLGVTLPCRAVLGVTALQG